MGSRWRTTQLRNCLNVTKMPKYSTYGSMCLELSTHLLVFLSVANEKFSLHLPLSSLVAKFNAFKLPPIRKNLYDTPRSLLNFPLEHKTCIRSIIKVEYTQLSLNGLLPGSNTSTFWDFYTRAMQQWYIYSQILQNLPPCQRICELNSAQDPL